MAKRYPRCEACGALSRIIEKGIALLEQTAQALPPSQTIAEIGPPSESLRALWKEWEPHFVAYLAWKREAQLAAPEEE